MTRRLRPMTLSLLALVVALVALPGTRTRACTSAQTWVGGLVVSPDGARYLYWSQTSDGAGEGGSSSVDLVDARGRVRGSFASNGAAHDDDRGTPAWTLRGEAQRYAALVKGVARRDADELARRVAERLQMRPLVRALDAATPLVANGACGAWLLRLRDAQPDSEDDEERELVLGLAPLTQAQLDRCDVGVLYLDWAVAPNGGCTDEVTSGYRRLTREVIHAAIAAEAAEVERVAELARARAEPPGQPRVDALRRYLRSHRRDAGTWHQLFVAVKALGTSWPEARRILDAMPRGWVITEDRRDDVDVAPFDAGDWEQDVAYQRWRRARTVLAKAAAVPWLVSDTVDCFAQSDRDGTCERDEDTGIYWSYPDAFAAGDLGTYLGRQR